MGRPPKDLSRSGLWHDNVVVDFLGRHPQGMYRPIDVDADPGQRIEAMPWWENRSALILVGCSDPRWDEARFLIWADALAEAAETRSAVLEIACAAHGADAPVDFGKLSHGFKCRRRPEKVLGLVQRMRHPSQADGAAPAYFHFVRIPAERDRPPPLTVPELISSLG